MKILTRWITQVAIYFALCNGIVVFNFLYLCLNLGEGDGRKKNNENQKYGK